MMIQYYTISLIITLSLPNNEDFDGDFSRHVYVPEIGPKTKTVRWSAYSAILSQLFSVT
jgi:hypothetical protein